jgi:hypothetical protein
LQRKYRVHHGVLLREVFPALAAAGASRAVTEGQDCNTSPQLSLSAIMGQRAQRGLALASVVGFKIVGIELDWEEPRCACPH